MTTTPDHAAVLARAAHLADPVALGVRLGRGRYRRARHLELLAWRLLQGVLGRITRQIISMPPRHGKSTTVSVWFLTWVLALWPHKEIILISATATKAIEWAKLVRQNLEEHWPELGVQLAHDSQAAYHWKTKEGGGLLAQGIGGSIIGSGADVFVIDDSVKDAVDAQSPTIQERNWNWYLSTASTRLSPDGFMLVLGTRWDENDLIGKLLKAQAGGPDEPGYDDWDVLNLVALVETQEQAAKDPLGRKVGDPLWPDSKWNAARLKRISRAVTPYWWNAMYQGGPTPPGGQLFKTRNWNYWVPPGRLSDFSRIVIDGRKAHIIELPKLDYQVQSWDCNHKHTIEALVEGRKPDPVAGHVWGRASADLFMLDRWYGPEADFNDTLEGVRAVTRRNPKVTTKLIEATANGPAVMSTLQHEVGGFAPITPTGSKVQRATMAAGAGEDDKGARAISFEVAQAGGNVYLPHPDLREYDGKEYSWVRPFRELMAKFPGGGKDDTDAATQAWAWLQQAAWTAVEIAHAEALKKKDAPKNTVEQLAADLRADIERKARSRRPRASAWRGRNW